MKNGYNVVSFRCTKDNNDDATYLLCLSEREVIERQLRAMEQQIASARFPILKTIDNFISRAQLPGKLRIIEANGSSFRLSQIGPCSLARRDWASGGLVGQ